MAKTHIEIDEATRNKLRRFKAEEGLTYDEAINQLFERPETVDKIDNTHGVTLDPDLIAQLLDEGFVTINREDEVIHLSYETIPRMMSDGWNE